MTFNFLVFTVTVKKRKYTSNELEQFIRDEKLQEEKLKHEVNYWLYYNRNGL
ncbi:YrzI family small protein [Halalkalibacterium halodurans]|jgi:uncharacterized protein (TIGR02413 family)|uniref:BH1206 protein n=1 Tax=Halalkalibacterium halodurans (strain ATCC BAA-125 / DSM 18197 / FERM 7344 / JCM 9153 / C-125) TaxID=272558 RepID=Q9KDK6_HALH5|nr:YrzI family small protein [Halalkalibacterium halodurans]MDY7221730.1 YrzI family small protein [Halalkalibacterium halodurans]MDY7241006.1 YrzI family small protein [Halalkalibacterium halodurans]MED3645581.1 YrzI family small protein [Halalkalibacterium halodurans]MED4079404.1 YrzI family small protein [Halalkalibacterium halodurans]MED4085475.1 YrzI family small protein [Halalkalibacterium halodurans]